MNGYNGYNSKDHILSIGSDIIDGFADGTKIGLAWESARTADKVGTDGHVVVSELHDLRATMTVALMPHATSNIALLRRERLRAKAPLELRTVAGELAVYSGICWVQRLPDINVEAEAGVWSWEIRLAEAHIRLLPQLPPVLG